MIFGRRVFWRGMMRSRVFGLGRKGRGGGWRRESSHFSQVGFVISASDIFTSPSFLKHVHFCFVHESYDTHLCSRRLLIRLVNGKEARIDASRPFVRSLQRIERCFDRRYIKRERENENKAFWNQTRTLPSSAEE